ncbi:MAG: leucine-rich repeat protein [Erysipelotrichaceae bacterium]
MSHLNEIYHPLFATLYQNAAFRESVEWYHLTTYYYALPEQLLPYELWHMWEKERSGLLKQLPALKAKDLHYLVEAWRSGPSAFHQEMCDQMEQFMWDFFPADAFFKIDADGTLLTYHGTLALVVTIPDTIQGIKVKTIGARAFEGKQLFEVNLPAHLEVIETRAFAFNALEKLHVPISLKEIKSQAFAHNAFAKVPQLVGVDIAQDAFVHNQAPPSFQEDEDVLQFPRFQA